MRRTLKIHEQADPVCLPCHLGCVRCCWNSLQKILPQFRPPFKSNSELPWRGQNQNLWNPLIQLWRNDTGWILVEPRSILSKNSGEVLFANRVHNVYASTMEEKWLEWAVIQTFPDRRAFYGLRTLVMLKLSYFTEVVDRWSRTA